MGHRSKEAEGRETLFLAADGSWGELEFLQLLRPYDTHRDSARGRYSGKLFVREFGSEDAGQSATGGVREGSGSRESKQTGAELS